MSRRTIIFVLIFYVLAMLAMPSCMSPGNQPDVFQQDTANPT